MVNKGSWFKHELLLEGFIKLIPLSLRRSIGISLCKTTSWHNAPCKKQSAVYSAWTALICSLSSFRNNCCVFQKKFLCRGSLCSWEVLSWCTADSLLEGETRLTVAGEFNREHGDPPQVQPANRHGNLNNTLPVLLLVVVAHLHSLPKPRPEFKVMLKYFRHSFHRWVFFQKCCSKLLNQLDLQQLMNIGRFQLPKWQLMFFLFHIWE